QYMELRYEDILDDPAGIVGRLCDFLGEPFSDKVIDFQKSRDPNTKTPLLKQGLQKTNQEKWRAAMSARQIRTFESVAGETLQACGYPLACPVRPQPWVERVLHHLHQRLQARLNPHPKYPRFKKRT